MPATAAAVAVAALLGFRPYVSQETCRLERLSVLSGLQRLVRPGNSTCSRKRPVRTERLATGLLAIR